MNQDFPDRSSIGDLTDDEKVALQALLVSTGLKSLSQTVSGQVKYSDVTTDVLYFIYQRRLENLSPNSKLKSALESLISNMAKFEESLIRFAITRSETFKYLIFTDKKFSELLGYLESSLLE